MESPVAQLSSSDLRDRLEAAVAGGMPRALADLASLVACRSVFDPRIEDPAECVRAAELTAALLTQAGVPVTPLVTPDGSLAVCGRLPRPGARRVLLYTHHDVVPVGDSSAWTSDPWTLTERDGRLYGRGAADCKGNLVAVLTALRAVTSVVGEWPVEVVVVVEGSEEQSGRGMEKLVAAQPNLAAADVIVMADTGNVTAGQPTLTTSLRGTASVRITVRTMAQSAHSGMYGGAAPDALQALLTTLASLRSPQGETTIDGLDASGVWGGAAYDPVRFRRDAAVLAGVDALGQGSIADLLWARPAATVLAQGLLVEHLRAHTPYGRVEIEPFPVGRGFAARTDGPAYAAMRRAMRTAYGREPVTTGQGGSIPLTVALSELHPEAEVLLVGVEEPECHIHAVDESVDPREIETLALALALLLCDLAA